MSNSLRPHELQHARPLCPSPTPGVHPNPCPSSRWYHSTISSSVIRFSSCPQSFPAAGSFQMSQLFASGGQSIGWSFSFGISPSSEYSGLISFRMDWLDLLAVQWTLKSLLQHHSSKWIPYIPEIPLLRNLPQSSKLYIHTKTWTWMFWSSKPKSVNQPNIHQLANDLNDKEYYGGKKKKNDW